MGLLSTDAVRQPLLPLADADRDRLATTLRELALLRTETSPTAVPEPVALIADAAQPADPTHAGRRSVARGSGTPTSAEVVA
jgi:hypothetical protein